MIDSILDLLEPADLARLSQVSRVLYQHASSDRVWQAIVQANVPGCTVDRPYPCPNFRSLYRALELHWFLPRWKLWFSGKDMAGRLVLMRYDPRRGCIEGYQLLAVSHSLTEHRWPLDPNVDMRAFHPEVRLHLDRPVVQLDARPADDGHTRPIARRLEPFLMHADEHLVKYFLFAARFRQPVPPRPPTPIPRSAFPADSTADSAANIAANIAHFAPNADAFFADADVNDFVAEYGIVQPPIPLPPLEYADFPYSRWWPPPHVPSTHRVSAMRVEADAYHDDPPPQLYPHGTVGVPTRRADITDRAFHLRTNRNLPYELNALHFVPQVRLGPSTTAPTPPLPLLGTGELETFATLDPVLYTPTADKPYRGIWVGDYGGHGCEFLLMHQPDDADVIDNGARDGSHPPRHYGGGGGDSGGGDSRPLRPRRYADETDEAYAARLHTWRVNHGRIEAIKLTGDPNVPRGQHSFIVPDLSDTGLDFVLHEPPFDGVRVVKGCGHIAGHGFRRDQFIDARVLLISHDRLAVYWVRLQHISFFERVDIDRFLAI